MKIWYCEEHGYQATEYAVNHSVEHLRQCWGTAYGEADGPWNSEEDYTPCRMVPMRLIPDTWIGVDRDALAAALEWYADMTYLDAKDAPMVDAARFVLQVLDGETP